MTRDSTLNRNRNSHFHRLLKTELTNLKKELGKVLEHQDSTNEEHYNELGKFLELLKPLEELLEPLESVPESQDLTSKLNDLSQTYIIKHYQAYIQEHFPILYKALEGDTNLESKVDLIREKVDYRVRHASSEASWLNSISCPNYLNLSSNDRDEIVTIMVKNHYHLEDYEQRIYNSVYLKSDSL